MQKRDTDKQGMYSQAQQSDEFSVQHRTDSIASLPLISEEHNKSCWLRSRANVISEFKYGWALAWSGWVFGIIAFLLEGYMHSVITNAVYRIHERGEMLQDLGFDLLPELPEQYGVLSNIIMGVLFFCLCSLALYPCLFPSPKHKNLHFILVASRYLGTMAFFQFLRCFTFSLTKIPSPAAHCRLDSTTYKPPHKPIDIWLRQDYQNGCGDLVFSSHVNFMFTIIAMHYHYLFPSRVELKIRRELLKLKAKGVELHKLLLKELPRPRTSPAKCCKQELQLDHRRVHNQAIKHLWGLGYWNPVWWLPFVLTVLGLVSGVLIVAERKHYSVDVVSSLYITIGFNLLLLVYYPDPVQLRSKAILKRIASIDRQLSAKSKV